MVLKVKHIRVTVLLLAAVYLPAGRSTGAGQSGQIASVKNHTPRNATDLHLYFYTHVKQVEGIQFNCATADGGAPSTHWTLTGGGVAVNDRELLSYVGTGRPKLAGADWSFADGSVQTVDPNDLSGAVISLTPGNRLGASGLGFVEPNVTISNPDHNKQVCLDNLRLWVGNDPSHFDAAGFADPTGVPVSGLPSSIILEPGQQYETGWLPEMAENSYLLLKATLTEGSNEPLEDWAFAYYDWPLCEAFAPGDVNQDCYVNLRDFVLFAGSWLECNHRFDSTCSWAGD